MVQRAESAGFRAIALTVDATAPLWSEGEKVLIFCFFIATGRLDHETVVLGFSTHRVEDGQDGASVYVRGHAARRGIGTLLLLRRMGCWSRCNVSTMRLRGFQ